MKMKTAALLAALCLCAGLPFPQAQEKETYVTVQKRLEAKTERIRPAATEVRILAKTESEILRASTSQRLEARTQRRILYDK